MTEPLKDLTREEYKQAVKDAIREWMDERFKVLGRWTAGTFVAALFAALVYLALIGSGWQHK